jgi:hypothetical protein
MRWKWHLIAFVLISCDPCYGAVAIRADTSRLADRLQRFRKYKLYELSAVEYQPIRREYLAWVDSRMKSGASMAQMNEELEAANLLSKGPENVPDDWFDRTYAGFLGGVGTVPIPGADDLIAVSLGVYTGGYCNFDETVVLYSRRQFRRIAQINAEPLYTHGYYLRALAAGKGDPARGRLVASAWVASNCTSNWNGNFFRIDIPRRGFTENALAVGMGAFNADEIRLTVENSTVTFDYTTALGDTDVLTREGIARYEVQDGHVIRQAPVAASFGGFIDEWLTMADAEAARWATPEAGRHHNELAAKFQKDIFEWRHVADCPGSPPTREVAVQLNKSKETAVFRITASSRAEMRMVLVSDKISPECREIPISDGLSSILAEPPIHATSAR